MRKERVMGDRNNIFFSIVTVCFNAERTIRSTIESVLCQKTQKFEYIIVDGASTDSTIQIVQKYAEVDDRIQWVSEPDRGIFHAMNKGIGYSKGDFLLFLNAGDTFHSDTILDKAAEVCAQSDIVIGDVAFKTETGLSEHKYMVGKELIKNLEKGENVCHQVIFASKMCLKDGFDECFTQCADYDWLCRQVNAKKRISKLDTVVVDYDINGITNQVRHQKTHWKEYFEVIKRNFPQTGFRYEAEVKKLLIQERKVHFLYEFMNRWLLLKQKNINLSKFFIDKKLKSIAIYGAHYMGQRLYDELQGSSVNVLYAIDKSPKRLDWQIPIYHPNDILENVDAIVITPIFDYLEIKDDLSEKLTCPMLSIEDVLFYKYSYD